MEEIFDVVDEQDRVIGQVLRSVVHAQGLRHRAVHIFLFNSSGQLLLQMRSVQKDEYSLCYTSSASGHLAAGETYDSAAPRELLEELGLAAPLERLASFSAGPETSMEHTVLYRAQSDTPPQPHPDEIAALEWHALADIDILLAEHSERFSPALVTLYRWYRARH